MAEKCKKIVLTIKLKLKLIEKFENRELATKLVKDDGIGIQTVHDVKNNKMKLMEFVRDCDIATRPSNRKSKKKSKYEEVDVALLQWFNQKLAEGTLISGPMCAQKAKFLHETLDLESEFNASIGWLPRLKQ
jgi:hypothetical protein